MKTIDKLSVFALCAMICAALTACDKDDNTSKFEPLASGEQYKARAMVNQSVNCSPYSSVEGYLTEWDLTNYSGNFARFMQVYQTSGHYGVRLEVLQNGELNIDFSGYILLGFDDPECYEEEMYLRIYYYNGTVREYYLNEDWRMVSFPYAEKGEIYFIEISYKITNLGAVSINKTGWACIEAYLTVE